MSEKEKSKWYEEHPRPLTGEALRDRPEGSAYMRFNQEISIRQEGRPIKMVHYVTIADISRLEESLV
jgi:hypothetical protein